MSLSAYAVRHPVTTLMAFLAVLMIGAFCLFQFPIDQLPDMDVPALTVLTAYPGAGPEDVENKVTQPLEDALAAVPDLKTISSTSREGLSRITLGFEWRTDLDTRANDARDAIDKARMYLPDEVDPPSVLKFNMADFPILILGVRAGESYPDLERILEQRITDPLKRIPGVAMAFVMTPLKRQVNVEFDRDLLAAHGLAPADLARALGAENQDFSAGNLKVGETDYLVRVPGEFREVEPMHEIVVAVRDGRPVRLRDVASVAEGFKEQTEFITIDGQPGAAIIIRKQSGANTVEVANAVRRRLSELTPSLPPDVSLLTVMDSSQDIARMVRNLAQTLWQGAGLAMLVVLLFLRRWRATLIIALAIPFSMTLALIGMFFLGFTINMMSLFGLIIAVGLIVDNAIVILENIARHREEGERPDEGAIYGTSEVALAVGASTLTTVCIFFPILFVQGVTRIFFMQFAVVASIALLGSLFSALTLTPMLCAKLLRAERFAEAPSNRLFRWSERGFEAIERRYVGLLGSALNHRGAVVLGATLLFGLTLLWLPRLGTEFMPSEDRNVIQGTIEMPVGTRVEVTREVLKALDRILIDSVADDERVATFTKCGTSGAGMGAVMGTEGAHIGSFSVRLSPPDRRSRSDRAIAAVLRERLQAIQGEWNIETFNVQTTDMMSGMLLGGERPITVNILGDDLDATDRLAVAIEAIVRETPGTVDVAISRQSARPELRIEPDRAKAAQLGLNVAAIGDTARAALYGAFAGKYRHQGDETDVFVRLREADRQTPEDLAALPLRLPSGRIVRLDHVAEIRRDFGPVQIERKDQTRVVNVTGDVYGRSLGEVTGEIEQRVGLLDIPPGIEVRLAGQAEELRDSFFWLSLALVIGVILVYMVMASQFESLLNPFIVMFSVPFALTGVIWGLGLRGYHINVIVFLGLLMLIGMVVNNAIVLVDTIGILRARGLTLPDAVRTAGRRRLRPVLMTALTTVVALLPMAVRRGQGAEVWNPLGTTVIAGLTVSTLVTLLLVPTLYSLFESRSSRTRGAAHPPEATS